MADTPHPSLHIDDDWKRQAQEEKRKLAEAEAAKRASAAPGVSPAGGGIGMAAGPGGAAAAGPATASPGASGRRSRRGGESDIPQASFGYLVQSVMTQALYYLGELGSRSGQTAVDLDMARLQVDLLSVLEEKTRGNISDEEQRLLDTALYEVRMRFVSVAREYVEMGQR